MSLKIWTWVNNSPVKLKLAPCQRLRWHSYELTDEGFRAEQRTWEVDRLGSCVMQTTDVRQRDCDGLYDDGEELFAWPADLKAGYADDDYPGVIYPRWQRGIGTHRDHTAESMGY
jgi:hypothetical protein